MAKRKTVPVRGRQGGNASSGPAERAGKKPDVSAPAAATAPVARSVAGLSGKDVQALAGLCHLRNRGWCLLHGDTSQPDWDAAPAWQRQSAIAGVIHVLESDAPRPEDSHENWLAEKRREGWTHGDVKDETAKTHPCMVPYDQLPEMQRRKDEIFIETVQVLAPALRGEADPVAALASLEWFHESARPGLPDVPDSLQPQVLGIETVSHVAASAHPAARRIYELLAPAGRNPDWWFSDGVPDRHDGLGAAAMVDGLARYVVVRPGAVKAETLYRHGVDLGAHPFAAGGFAERPAALRAAYEVFALVADGVSAWLAAEQQRAWRRLNEACAVVPPVYRAADSVMEKHGHALAKHRLSGR